MWLPALGPVTEPVRLIGTPSSGKAGAPLMATWSVSSVRLLELKTGSRNRPPPRFRPLSVAKLPEEEP